MPKIKHIFNQIILKVYKNIAIIKQIYCSFADFLLYYAM